MPVDSGGVADVNVSASLRLASRGTVTALSAQLAWTLRQLSGVTAMRLLVDGAPLSVGGVVRQPIQSYAQFDPAPRPRSRSLMWVDGGRVHGGGIIPSRTDLQHAVSVAASADGRTFAVVQTIGRRVRLVVGHAAGTIVRQLVVDACTAPTFDAFGDVIAVVTDGGRRRVVAVSPSGSVRAVATDAAVIASPVSALRISRDGARVAVVNAAGRLLVGHVNATRDQVALHDFAAVLPTVSGVAGITWSGADALLLTATASGTARQVIETTSDGYLVRTLATDALPSPPVDVADAPGAPLAVATADGRLWSDAGGWHRLAVGTAPAYAG